MSFPRLFKKRSKKGLPGATTKDGSPPLPSPTSPPRSASSPLPQTAPSLSARGYLDSGGEPTDRPIPTFVHTSKVTEVDSDHKNTADDHREMGSNAERNVPRKSDGDVTQPSPVDAALNSVDDRVSAIRQMTSPLQSLVTPVDNMVRATGAVQTFQHQFLDATPVLMKALNEVAKLHPFIGVAVLAFKTVYTLDMKRRDNDRKIDALRAEMKDMMAVLMQLGHLKDEEDVGPDNRTIKSRMEILILGAADDMEQCGNACDAYMKTRLLTRVIKGPIWDVTLVDFAGRFEKRKAEFEFALSVHSGIAIDCANDKLDGLQGTTHEIMLRMDAMRESFKTMLTPIMKELDARIRQEGVSEVLNNDSLLRELNGMGSKPNSLSSYSEGPSGGRGRTDLSSEFKELRKELEEDPETAVERNYEVFSRKFEVQKREIVQEIDRLVVRESDRVIESVLAGPHEKILDRQLYTIWKDMGWRGNVKARHFVLALRDFFYEQLEARKNSQSQSAANTNNSPIEKQPEGEGIKCENRVEDLMTEEAKEDTETKPAEVKIALQVTDTIKPDAQPLTVIPRDDAKAHESEAAGPSVQDSEPAANRQTEAERETDAQPKDSNPEGSSPHESPGSEAVPQPEPVAAVDDLEWTLEWITLTRLQPMMEAFDDDASGFITVAEANRLTASRPHDWSLLHWLAYWAIGWQITSTVYRDKINDILMKMASLRTLVHPTNRANVDEYFREVWTRVGQTCMSFKPYYPPDPTLQAKFQSYIDSEDERIRHNLEEFEYDIDALDTLALITGPGRIEKFLFPLLYMLLKRDYEKLRLCQTLVLHDDELWDAYDTVIYVYDAVFNRENELQGIFEQQKLNVDQQFKIFACGMFNYWHDPKTHWSAEKFRQMEFTEYTYDDSVEAKDVVPTDLLSHPYHTEFRFDSSVFDEPEEYIKTEQDKNAVKELDALLGKWCGFLAQGDKYPCQLMISMIFHSSANNDRTFEAKTLSAEGVELVITGHCESEPDDRTCYAFTMRWLSTTISDSLKTFRGYINEDATTLQGKWGNTDNLDNTFIFKRVAPWIMCCRPAPAAFEENKPRALWRYAITMARNQVLRSRLSWSYLKKRRDDRKRIISLFFKWPLTDEDTADATRIKQSMTVAEGYCYYWMGKCLQWSKPTHHTESCAACGKEIVGSRVVCIDCNTWSTIDFCDSPECMNAEISVKQKPELPAPHDSTHTVFKSLCLLSSRDYGRLTRAAREALNRAKIAFDDMADAMQNRSQHQGSRTVDLLKKELKCTSCKLPVSRPCWCCAICKDNVFICEKCDREQYWYISKDIKAGVHRETHILVRCQEERQAEVALPVQQQMKILGDRFDALNGKVERVDDRLDRMEQSLGKMEKLLELILTQRHLDGVQAHVHHPPAEESDPMGRTENGHVSGSTEL